MFSLLSAIVDNARHFVEGERVPLSSLTPSSHAPALRLSRDPDEFMYPRRVYGDDRYVQDVGAWLLYLAAEGGVWHAVPWRRLRNAALRHGIRARWRRKADKRLPVPITNTSFAGDFDLELQNLRRGIDGLIEAGQVVVVTLEDEDYLVPTEALLDRVPLTEVA